METNVHGVVILNRFVGMQSVLLSRTNDAY